MSLIDKSFKTNFEGEPPEGIFLQINVQPSGKVTYRYTNDPEKWPQDGVALHRVVGVLTLITWQMASWATKLMSVAERSQTMLAELLAKLPGGETWH